MLNILTKCLVITRCIANNNFFLGGSLSFTNHPGFNILYFLFLIKMKYTYYGHLTSKEAQVAAKKKYILVLPIGAIEQHGPHLPIDTDDWLALKAAKEGVELAVKKYKINAMYLPGIHFGQSFSHLAWPGRISLSFNTFVSVIYEVIDLSLIHI